MAAETPMSARVAIAEKEKEDVVMRKKIRTGI